MSLYETIFIARQELSPGQAEKLAEKFSAILSDNGGALLSEEYWGLRTLAYPIKKNSKGHYLFLRIECNAEALSEMERMMRLNDDVIRYLSVRVDSHAQGPSVVMKNIMKHNETSEEG